MMQVGGGVQKCHAVGGSARVARKDQAQSKPRLAVQLTQGINAPASLNRLEHARGARLHCVESLAADILNDPQLLFHLCQYTANKAFFSDPSNVTGATLLVAAAQEVSKNTFQEQIRSRQELVVKKGFLPNSQVKDLQQELDRQASLITAAVLQDGDITTLPKKLHRNAEFLSDSLRA